MQRAGLPFDKVIGQAEDCCPPCPRSNSTPRARELTNRIAGTSRTVCEASIGFMEAGAGGPALVAEALRDPDLIVRQSAIQLRGRIKDPRTWNPRPALVHSAP